ncbi:MAG TPA: hypothetical protein EYP53_04375 [Candidatus Latescibacteria bacterium]|nr:hypothetical protein [Candidatus Latescibacterota bacterium]
MRIKPVDLTALHEKERTKPRPGGTSAAEIRSLPPEREPGVVRPGLNLKVFLSPEERDMLRSLFGYDDRTDPITFYGSHGLVRNCSDVGLHFDAKG